MNRFTEQTKAMRLGMVRAEQKNVSASLRRDAPVFYSTLPIRFTAATRRALSVSTNFANSGASM